ncbi:MAG: LysR family transcriptional regulator substrate-binding protein [Tissierellia bacterium]|nr:LysR family transcriptional regulator substrate-binding protein [Tissierellia bacterium]
MKEHINHLENIKFEELIIGKYVCVMPGNYILSNKNIITINDLANHSIIALDPISCPAEMLRIYDNIRNYNPNDIKYFCDHPKTICTMIKRGFGVSLLVPYETNESISYGIALNKNYETKEIKSFIEIAKMTCFIEN